MRKALFVAALLALAIPAIAHEKKPDTCIGEKFVINGKTYCMVAVSPEDYYRTADAPQKDPAPGSLVRMPDEPEPPHLKMAGHLLVNGMMQDEFDAAQYTYERSRYSYSNLPRLSGAAFLQRERTGWGASLQWSPDGKFWIETSWQRPERLGVALDSVILHRTFTWRLDDTVNLGEDKSVQRNRHDFTADDFTLGILYDITENRSKHFSILVGGGVHRRYLRDRYTIDTESGEDWWRSNGTLFLHNNRYQSSVSGTVKTTQTRVFGQLDLELYPAGKNRWVGLVLSTRLLSDGNREQQIPAFTLNDSDIIIGIQPGFYDVTARLVVRF